MLNEEICRLRERLNDSIINGEDYSITYKISVELDQLIAEYYKIELNVNKKKKVKERIKKKRALRWLFNWNILKQKNNIIL